LVGPIITPSFNKLADYFCSNAPHRQTDRMTDRQTDRPDCITSTLVEVTLVLPANRMEIITSSKQNSNRVKHKTTNEIFLSWSSSVAWIYRVFMFWCRPAHNYWHLAVLSTWMYKLMSHHFNPYYCYQAITALLHTSPSYSLNDFYCVFWQKSQTWLAVAWFCSSVDWATDKKPKYYKFMHDLYTTEIHRSGTICLLLIAWV